jgi:hypothetical protein
MALAAGLFCVIPSFILAALPATVLKHGARDFDLAIPLSPVVCYGVAGGVFGLVWPERGWRWGMWLCAMPLGLSSFIIPDLPTFFTFLAMSLAPSCACAHVAARAHLKYAEVK